MACQPGHESGKLSSAALSCPQHWLFTLEAFKIFENIIFSARFTGDGVF